MKKILTLPNNSLSLYNLKTENMKYTKLQQQEWDREEKMIVFVIREYYKFSDVIYKLNLNKDLKTNAFYEVAKQELSKRADLVNLKGLFDKTFDNQLVNLIY
jgi:hypothetical protein